MAGDSWRLVKWLIVALLPLVSMAGCIDGPTPPSGKFLDADHRFAGVEREAFEFSQDLALPAGAHTLQISVKAEAGFGILLVSPEGNRDGFTHVREVDIGLLEYKTKEGQGGTWKLTIGCEGPCEYAVGLNEGGFVRDAEVPMSDDGLKAHVHGSQSGKDGDQWRVERVPVRHEDVMLVFNVRAEGKMEWSMHDGDGDLVSYWIFDDVTAREWRFEPAREMTAPGEWRIGLECYAPCEYSLGIA